MSEISLFFNSTFENRRRYTAADIAEYWKSFLSTGLISWDGEPLLRVVADGKTNVITIKPGRAHVEGHLYRNKADLQKEIPLPESKGSRIDRVVLRLHNQKGVKDSLYVRTFIKEGTAEGPPALERSFIEGEAVIYELSLAQVQIREGVTYITQDDIIDERLDEVLCGMASSLVRVPTEIFGEQWRDFVDEYYTWFEDIKNESYATEKEVRQRDHALKREIAYLEMMMEADRRIKNGVVFADNFKGNPHNIEYLKGKAELAEDVIPNDKTLKFKNAHDFHAGIKEISIYDEEKQERLQIESIVGDTIYLSKAIVNGFKAQAMLFESVHQIEDGYMKVGKVPSGMTVELNNIDLVDIYDEWYIYEDHFYLIAGNRVYYYDVLAKTKKLLGTGTKTDNMDPVIPFNRGIAINLSGRFTYYYRGQKVNEVTWSVANITAKQKYGNKTCVVMNREAGSGTTFYYILKETSSGLRFEEDNTRTLYSYDLMRPQMISDDEFLTFEFRIGTRDLRVYSKTINGDRGPLISSGTADTHPYTSPREKEVVYFPRGGNFIKIYGTDNTIQLGSSNLKIVKQYDDGYFVYLLLSDGRYIKWGNEVFELKDDGLINESNIITPYLEGKKKEKFFQLINGRYADGRFFEGIIFEPKEADIRFRVPRTKEVVAYIENNGLGEYSGWFNQHSTADAKMGNEIQMVGTSSNEYDTFRLTVKRDSVNQNNRITRILGGVL